MDIAAKIIVIGVPSLIIFARQFREKYKDRVQKRHAMNAQV